MVVRMRHNRSQTGQHRAHKKATRPTLSIDTKTQSVHLRHRVDMATGLYRGKKVLDIVSKVQKKQSKSKA